MPFTTPPPFPDHDHSATNKGGATIRPDLIVIRNNKVICFEDTAGRVITRFVPQSDDNFVFYVSDDVGGSVAMWSSMMNRPSRTFNMPHVATYKDLEVGTEIDAMLYGLVMG